MNLEKTLITFVEEHLLEGQFLVELKISAGSSKVSVAVDTEEGILIDACGKISRALGEYIEEEELIEGAYTLEVSSPGLDHPLLRIEQYRKSIDRDLRLQLENGTEISGRLDSVSEEFVTFTPFNTRTKKKSKEYEKELITIELKNILKAYIIVSFN
jgi:ribosome maturation factor RimP